MKKKILITGGGGFIGGHLANFYHKKGFKVISVDLKKKNYWFQVNPKIKNIVADCRDPLVSDRITKNVDYVFNLLVKTIAFDLTNLLILKANSTCASSFFVGFFFVTNFKFFFSKIALSLSCSKKEPSNIFATILFF